VIDPGESLSMPLRKRFTGVHIASYERRPKNVGLDDARPRPAAGLLFPFGQALLVDIYEHDIAVRQELGRLAAHEAIE
jgi:hypothetical protein